MRRKFFLQSAQSKRSADSEADATGWLNTTYAQHGLVNIAKKKRELKSFQNQLFEEIFDDEIKF